MILWARKQRGFTIVELLIVVVVIAILAAVVIVAYSGISQQAKTSAVQNALQQAAKKMESVSIQGGTGIFPATLTAAGVSAGGDVTLDYFPAYDNASYCLEATEGSVVWSVNSGNLVPVEGACPDSGLLAWWPMNGNFNDATGNGYDLASATGIPVSVTGQSGQAGGAYSFGGTSYVDVDSVGITGAAYTVTVWANVATLYAVSGGQAPFFGDSTGQNLASRNLHLGVRNTRPFMGYFSSDFGSGATTTTLGSWQHYAFVGLNTGVRQVYLNGTLQATSGSLGKYLGVLNRIGQNCCMTGALDGSLDDARVYNRALSAAEISAIYAAGAQ